MKRVDAHNHLHDWGTDQEIETLLNAEPIHQIARFLVNGTCPDDWQRVSELSQRHTAIHPSFGLHPWKLNQASSDWKSKLRQFLTQHPEAGVGECGVDLWIKDADREQQRRAFLPQLRLAKELRRPLTVHCLKAWQLLLDCFDEEVPPDHGFLLHGFGGGPEIAERFVKLGAYFSFNASFMAPRKSAVREAFRQIPAERILIETDAPAMSPPAEHWHASAGEPMAHNHPINLICAYQALAEIRRTTPDDLASEIWHNHRQFIGCAFVT